MSVSQMDGAGELGQEDDRGGSLNAHHSPPRVSYRQRLKNNKREGQRVAAGPEATWPPVWPPPRGGLSSRLRSHLPATPPPFLAPAGPECGLWAKVFPVVSHLLPPQCPWPWSGLVKVTQPFLSPSHRQGGRARAAHLSPVSRWHRMPIGSV